MGRGGLVALLRSRLRITLPELLDPSLRLRPSVLLRTALRINSVLSWWRLQCGEDFGIVIKSAIELA